MNVERLISEIAHDIATVEPSAGFSARVLDRLDIARRRSRAIRSVGLATGLLAAAALAVFVVRIPRSHQTTASGTPGRVEARVETPAAVSQSLVTSAAAQTADTIVSKKPRRTPQPAETPTTEQEWLARALPRLEATKPITIEKPHTGESIQPASLQIPLMGMDMIGSDPLTIAPIGSRHE